MSQGFTRGVPIDTDPTLSLDSDLVVPSQKAIKAYVDNQDALLVADVTATAPLTSSGGPNPDISTSMSTDKLIGRGTAGTGVMEEITLGTGLDLAATTLNVGNIDLAVISVTSTNAREDNWAPTGWPGAVDVVKVIDFTPNNTNNIISLGGLANPSAGRIVTIVNSSTNNLVIIENEASTSTAANRFKLAQKSPYFLMPDREITFLYTGTRWSQFNTHPNQGGFDFYDDFENLNPTAASQATKMFYGVTSGTGSGLASGAETSDVWGVMRLSAGTTITGFLYASVDYRRFGGSTVFGVNGLCPQLWVSKVKIDTIPTAAQDWNFNAGLNASTSTVATNGQTGLMWEMPTFASGGVTPAFWNIRITNVANSLTILTATTVPITAATYIYLGIFITSSNSGDAIFFYSTDGITYSFAYRFTRVSGNYGGLPFYRLGGSAGTLNTRSASVDWCGESFNLKR
jgi:hypothetical protein